MKCNINFPVEKKYMHIEPSNHYHTSLTPVMSYSYSCIQAYSQNREVVKNNTLHCNRKNINIYPDNRFHISGERDCPINSPFYFKRTINIDEISDALAKEISSTGNLKTTESKHNPDSVSTSNNKYGFVILNWIKSQLKYVKPFLICSSPSNPNIGRPFFNRKKGTQAQVLLDYNINSAVKSEILKFVRDLNLKAEEIKSLNEEKTIQIDVTPLMNNPKCLQKLLNAIKIIENKINMSKHELNNYQDSVSNNHNLNEIEERNVIHLNTKFENKLNQNIIKNVNSNLHRPLLQRDISKLNKNEAGKRHDNCLDTNSFEVIYDHHQNNIGTSIPLNSSMRNLNFQSRNKFPIKRTNSGENHNFGEPVVFQKQLTTVFPINNTPNNTTMLLQNNQFVNKINISSVNKELLYSDSNSDLAAPITTNMGLNNNKYYTKNRLDNINVNLKQRNEVDCTFEPCTMQAESNFFNISKENDYNKNALKKELQLVLNNTDTKQFNKHYFNNLQEDIDNKNNQELINNINLPQFIIPECSHMVKPNVQHINNVQNISSNNQMLKNCLHHGNITNNIVQMSLENEKPITNNNHDIQKGTVNNVLFNICKGPSIVKTCKSVRNIKGNITQKQIITNELLKVSKPDNYIYKAVTSKARVNRLKHISENKSTNNMDLRNVSRSPKDSIVHFASEQGDNIGCNINKQLLNYENDQTITSSIDIGTGLGGNGDSAKTVDKQTLSKEFYSKSFNFNDYVNFIRNIRENEYYNNKHCHENIDQPYNDSDWQQDLNINSKLSINGRNHIFNLPDEKRKTNHSSNFGSGCTVKKNVKNNNNGKQKVKAQLKKSSKLDNVQQMKTNIKTNIVNKHNMLEECLINKLSTEVNEIFVSSSTMPFSSSSQSYKNKSHNKMLRSKVRKQTTFTNTLKNNSKKTYYPKSNKSIISIKSKRNKFSNNLRKKTKITSLTSNPAENDNVKRIIPSYTVNRITKITSLPKLVESGRIKSSQQTNLPRTSKRIIVQCSASKPTGDVSTLFCEFNRCSNNDKSNSIHKIVSLEKPKDTESKDNNTCNKHSNTDENNMTSSPKLFENMNVMDITSHRSVHHYTGPEEIHAKKDYICYNNENCKQVRNDKNIDSGKHDTFCRSSFVSDMGNFITDYTSNKQESFQYSKQNKIKSQEILNSDCVCLDSLTYGTKMINKNIFINNLDNFKQPESRTEHILAKKPKYNHICHDTQIYRPEKINKYNPYNKKELYYKQNEMKSKSYIKTNSHNICNDTLIYNGRKINEHLPHDEKEYHTHSRRKNKSEDMLPSNCVCHGSLTYNKRAQNPIPLHNERKYPTVTKNKTKSHDSNSRYIWNDMLIYNSKNINYNLPNSENQFLIHSQTNKNVECISNFHNFNSDRMLYNNLNINQNLPHKQSENKNKSHEKLKNLNICHDTLTYKKGKLNNQNICHDTLTYNKEKINHQNIYQDKLTTNREKLMNGLQQNVKGYNSCRQNENKSQSQSNYNYFCHDMLRFNNERINDNLLNNEREYSDICEMKPRSQNKPDYENVCHDTLTYNKNKFNNALQHNERGSHNYGQSENKLLGSSKYNYFCHDMQTFNNEKISYNFQHNSREHSDICEKKSRLQDKQDYKNICCHTLNYNKRKLNENLQSDKEHFICSESKRKTHKKFNCECMFHDSLICDKKKQNFHEYKTFNSESKFMQSLHKDCNTCVSTICYPCTCSLNSELEKQSKISVNGNANSSTQNYLDFSQGKCRGRENSAQFGYNGIKENVFHTKTRENITEQDEKVQNKFIGANSLYYFDKHDSIKSSKSKQRHLIYGASNSPKSDIQDGNLWKQDNCKFPMSLSDESKLYTPNDPSILKCKTQVKDNQSNVDILTDDAMPVLSDLNKFTTCSEINHDARYLGEPILDVEKEQNENKTLNVCFDSLYYKNPIFNPEQNVNDSETLLSSNNSRHNDTTTTYSPGTSTTNRNTPLEYDIVLHSESDSRSSSSGLIIGDSSSGVNTPIKLLLKIFNDCDFFENLNEYSENHNSEGGQHFEKSNCKQLRNDNDLNTSCVDIGQVTDRTLSGRGNSRFMDFNLHKCGGGFDNNQTQCRQAKSNKRKTGIVINNNNVKPDFKKENINQPLVCANICSNFKEVKKEVDNILKYEQKALFRDQPNNRNKIIRVERHPNYIYAHERSNTDDLLISENKQKKDCRPTFNPKVLFREISSIDKFNKGSKERSVIYACADKAASFKNTKNNINQDFNSVNRDYIHNDSTAIDSNIKDNKSCNKLKESNSISLLIPKKLTKFIYKLKNFHKSNNLDKNDAFKHNIIENLKKELHSQRQEISDIKKDFIKIIMVITAYCNAIVQIVPNLDTINKMGTNNTISTTSNI